VLIEVREEHQDNTRGTRDVLTSQTVTSIDTYRSCTKGVQKTAYLHLGNSELKYM
jgi:hypothetical protein